MNPELQQLLLENLAPLDDPTSPIGWWPPAPGWWILAGLILAISFAIAWRMRVRWRLGAPLRSALGELAVALARWLDDGDEAAYLQRANQIIKRLALLGDEATQVAQLSGRDWHRYLAMRDPHVSAATLDALSDAAYQARPQADIQVLHPELLQLSERLAGGRRA